jgi:putative ABC transport system ATP-binding protein
MKINVQNVQTSLFQVRQFALNPGERILIKGPSGKGKTTFLHLLAGLYVPQQGQISWDEKEFSDEHSLSLLRKKQIAVIFQNLNLLNFLTAQENVELSGATSLQAQEMLTLVGLKEKFQQRTQSLSLGEQQRVAVARVLAQNPEIILADEPTSSLDDSNAEKIMDLLLSGPASQSVVMVSHDHRIEKYFKKTYSIEEILR